MLNLPNFLTLIRIVTIPFFLVLLSSRLYWDALFVFILGALTDALDGPIARRTHQLTAVGSLLDPMADKLLITASYIMLGLIGGIPEWLVFLTVTREVIGMVTYVTISSIVKKGLEVQHTLTSTLDALIHFVAVAVFLIFLGNRELFPAAVYDTFIFLTAAVTVASGLRYIYGSLVWLQHRTSPVAD